MSISPVKNTHLEKQYMTQITTAEQNYEKWHLEYESLPIDFGAKVWTVETDSDLALEIDQFIAYEQQMNRLFVATEEHQKLLGAVRATHLDSTQLALLSPLGVDVEEILKKFTDFKNQEAPVCDRWKKLVDLSAKTKQIFHEMSEKFEEAYNSYKIQTTQENSSPTSFVWSLMKSTATLFSPSKKEETFDSLIENRKAVFQAQPSNPGEEKKLP